MTTIYKYRISSIGGGGGGGGSNRLRVYVIVIHWVPRDYGSKRTESEGIARG